MQTVYASIRDSRDHLVCIVCVPRNSSLYQLEQALMQIYSKLNLPSHPSLLTETEAKSYVEMGVCDFVDLTKIADSLKPIQGWSD